MTLYSKPNLTVAAVASDDQYDRHMNGVRLDPDGATVACNSRVLLAVSPADEDRVQFPDVGPRGEPGEDGLFLRKELVQDVLKNMPKDKRVSAQHAALTLGRSAGKVEFTTVTAGGLEKRVAGIPKRDQYINWKAIVRKAREPDPANVDRAEAGEPMRVCVSRKDLMSLLKTMEQACPDKGGDSPVFIEIGRGMVMRSRNRDTGQHVLGVAVPYRLKGQDWLEEGGWEKGIFNEDKKRVVRRKV